MIMKDMLNTSAVASGSKAGLVSNTIKKKGRRKNSDIQLELLQHQQYAVAEDLNEDENSDNNSVDSGGSDKHIVAGKVMRKRKEVQYDDHLTDLQYTRMIDKQGDVAAAAASSTTKAAAAGTTIYKELVAAINAIQKLKREDGSQLAFIFIDKPPKSLYPDYYTLITEPIALKQIQGKLRKAEYNYFEELELDLALMCHNARVYNLDTSPVYSDCELLRSHFYALAVPLLRKYSVADADNTTALPLPAQNHYIYPAEYVYRRLLPHTELQQSSSTAAYDEQEGPTGAGASAKKIAKNKKRALDEDFAVTPSSAATKKKARVSTSSGLDLAYSDHTNSNATSNSNLSLSLKKQSYSSNNSLYDANNNNNYNTNEESLYLSIPLKRKKE